jgi:hypothetical protein
MAAITKTETCGANTNFTKSNKTRVVVPQQNTVKKTTYAANLGFVKKPVAGRIDPVRVQAPVAVTVETQVQRQTLEEIAIEDTPEVDNITEKPLSEILAAKEGGWKAKREKKKELPYGLKEDSTPTD